MTARIYRPSRPATQSGAATAKFWILEFEPAEPRRIDPLMGWTGSGDVAGQVRLRFATKDEAIAYAEKNGLSYFVDEPEPVSRKILSYSDNFKPRPHRPMDALRATCTPACGLSRRPLGKTPAP